MDAGDLGQCSGSSCAITVVSFAHVDVSGAIVSGAWELRGPGGTIAEGAVGACTPSTRFQAASISKQFVAACVLLLEEQGVLSVADPVSRWWEAPRAWDGITVGHLLAHTSGLPHWSAPLDDEVPPLYELLGQAARTRLLAAPGARWAYSGPGYLVAAAIVETAAGQPYGRFVEEAILAPLQMSATTSGRIPGSHALANGVDPPLAGLTDLPGTGDLWSTPTDLLRFAAACLERRWSRLTTLQAQIDDETAYGYGVYLGTIDGQPIRYHTGDNPGYRSVLAWLPESGVSFCALCNDDTADMPRALREALTMEAR
jgi:CubicO group peptidase (beta-lactamase class C family)